MTRLKKLPIATIIFAAAMATLTYGYWLVDPVGFRLNLFQPAKEITILGRELEWPREWKKIEKIRIPPPEVIRIRPTGSQGITIVADVYQYSKKEEMPAMIVLHGSQPWGRKQGLIRLLAHHYAQKGWFILAPDARGFGDTDDPADTNDPELWDIDADLRRIIDYVSSLSYIDKSNIYLFGHSLGANHAMEGGIRDSRLRAIIALGPSRHFRDIMDDLGKWRRTRFSADRKLDSPIDPAVLIHRRPKTDIRIIAEKHLGPGSSHPPILLIDGEREGIQNLNHLSRIKNKISPPVSYHTLTKTGHYAGVVNLSGSDLVYYRPDLFHGLTKTIDNFIREQGGAKI